MTPAERQDLESRADRHLRRGELGDAWALARRLADAFPDDAAALQRLTRVEELVPPAERRRTSPPPTVSDGAFTSPVHRAEALAASGQFKDAIVIYRQLLDATPDAQLLRERLAELAQLAQVSAPGPRPGPSRAQVLELLLERIASRRRGP